MVATAEHLTIGMKIASLQTSRPPVVQIEATALQRYVEACCHIERQSDALRQTDIVLGYDGPQIVECGQPSIETVCTELRLSGVRLDSTLTVAIRDASLARSFDGIRFWSALTEQPTDLAARTFVIDSPDDFPVSLRGEDYSYLDMLLGAARKQFVLKSAQRVWIGKSYKTHAWPDIFRHIIAQRPIFLQEYVRPMQLTLPGLSALGSVRCALRIASIGTRIIASSACLEPVKMPSARIRIPVVLI